MRKYPVYGKTPHFKRIKYDSNGSLNKNQLNQIKLNRFE